MAASLLFITGMPRSGTTLLSTLMGRRRDLIATPETHFFSRCYPAGDLRAPLQPQGVRRLAACIERGLGLPRLGGESEAGSTPLDVFLAGVHQFAASHRPDGAAWIAEKTPAHHEHVPRIAEALPTARFLTIVRDPRAVSASLQRVPWNPEPALHHALRWRRYAERTFEYQRTLRDRYRWIRYEDLIAEGAGHLGPVWAWLGIAAESPLPQTHDEPLTTFDPALEPWKANASRPLDHSRVDAWRDNLSAETKKVIELGAGPMMAPFGYDPDGDAWTAAIAAGVAAELCRYVPRRVRNKLRYWRERSMGTHLHEE